jgi:hypothetical protein
LLGILIFFSLLLEEPILATKSIQHGPVDCSTRPCCRHDAVRKNEPTNVLLSTYAYFCGDLFTTTWVVSGRKAPISHDDWKKSNMQIKTTEETFQNQYNATRSLHAHSVPSCPRSSQPPSSVGHRTTRCIACAWSAARLVQPSHTHF